MGGWGSSCSNWISMSCMNEGVITNESRAEPLSILLMRNSMTSDSWTHKHNRGRCTSCRFTQVLWRKCLSKAFEAGTGVGYWFNTVLVYPYSDFLNKQTQKKMLQSQFVILGNTMWPTMAAYYTIKDCYQSKANHKLCFVKVSRGGPIASVYNTRNLISLNVTFEWYI